LDRTGHVNQRGQAAHGEKVMLRVGLIGYGAWGTHHARVIEAHPEASLVAIAARSAETAARAQAAHPHSRVSTDYRDLLAQELDAVAVVLPSHLHFEVSRDVLASGRHLLLEKPMALSVAHCDELTALARGKDRVLAVGHEMRLSSLWGKVKEMLDDGAIGVPLYALIELWRKPYRQGADGWRYDIGRVGDWILEEPIHFFDLARWYFCDAGAPVSIVARANGRRPDHPELQDNFTATLELPDGRFVVVAQTLGGWEHHQTVKIAGRDGALWASWSGATDRTMHPSFSLRWQRNGAVEEIAIPHPAGEVFELEAQFARFVQAIRGGIAPAATAEDGRWSVALCLAAQQSIRSGVPVRLAR
jgi:myo-inositol 2-dehydrogenase/D-chiro-inositol 1-dehydrogenase